MCEQTGNLLLDFEKSIFDNVLDISIDILEIPIDEFIDNEALKQVPVIGTIIGLGKATVAVRDMHLMKKLITFIAKINDGKMTRKKLNKYKEKLEKNKEKLKQEIEYLIVMLEQMSETRKANILANLYLKYIDEEIQFSWRDFCIFAEILERFSVYDAGAIIDLYDKKVIRPEEQYNALALTRISSLGLADFLGGMRMSIGRQECVAKINQLGELFVEMAFMDNEKKIITFGVKE